MGKASGLEAVNALELVLGGQGGVLLALGAHVEVHLPREGDRRDGAVAAGC